MRGNGRYTEGVAIRLRLGNCRRADAATAAASILDHHWLAEFLAQLVANDARDDIGGATRRKRNDQPDRFGRISLSLRGCRESEARYERQQQFIQFHVFSSLIDCRD